MFSHEDNDDDRYISIEGVELFYDLHGRRFNTINPTYLLPADSEEQERYDLFHRMIQFILHGRSFVGPVHQTLQFGEHRKVLDLGTGKGNWAVEMCERFPWVKVTGVDLVPIQERVVPENCRFEIWDINTYDMPYENEDFDLIHARAVHTGIRDYPRFLNEVARILRPGGLVILIEPDLRQFANDQPELQYTHGSGPRGWFTLWETYRGVLVSLGVDVTVPQHLGQLLQETGRFENVTVQEGIIPVGFYHTNERILTIGELMWMAYDLFIPALKPMFLSLGIPVSRVDQIIRDAQQDLYYTDFFLSSRLHIVYATKREG